VASAANRGTRIETIRELSVVFPSEFALIVNLIQMKSMKVIDTCKIMMNQKFQHCSESRLIEVMILKIHRLEHLSLSRVGRRPSLFGVARAGYATYHRGQFMGPFMSSPQAINAGSNALAQAFERIGR
jgi:hypothetical protein